jgi:threonine/homoserine/homoserine lactone efflux protein
MVAAALIGFLAGFVGSMPVAGPIAILVFGRGLEDRTRSAIYLAVGAALAESVYAYLAFWGFGELLASYEWIDPVSRGLAAVLLTVLGLRFALKRNTPEPVVTPPDPAIGNKRSFLLGMTITALNPTLVATWGAAVTFLYSLHVVEFGWGRALPFSIGVCLGISAWFVVLLWLLARYKSRFRRATLERVIRIMGMVLTGLGLLFAVRFAAYFGVFG